MQCRCMMGIFPEINRAYLTIDSDIYIWDFETGHVLFSYFLRMQFLVGILHILIDHISRQVKIQFRIKFIL